MSDLNQCTFSGRLGKDVELRTTQNGQSVGTTTLACGYKYKDTEHTEWVNCVVWGKQAEILQQYRKKGDQLIVTGRLQTRSYDDRDGNKRYVTEVIVQSFNFVGKSEGQQSQPQQQSQGGGWNSTPQQPFDPSQDIPF